MLDWASNEGFDEFFSRFSGDGFTFSSAYEYRNRHILRALGSGR